MIYPPARDLLLPVTINYLIFEKKEMKNLLFLFCLFKFSISFHVQGDLYGLDGRIFYIENVANGKYLEGNTQILRKKNKNIISIPYSCLRNAVCYNMEYRHFSDCYLAILFLFPVSQRYLNFQSVRQPDNVVAQSFAILRFYTRLTVQDGDQQVF